MPRNDYASQLQVIEVKAPAHWAVLLINGDASSLDDSEQAECDSWLAKQSDFYVVNCSEETHFGRFNGRLCELVTYVLHCHE